MCKTSGEVTLTYHVIVAGITLSPEDLSRMCEEPEICCYCNHAFPMSELNQDFPRPGLYSCDSCTSPKTKINELRLLLHLRTNASSG